MKIDKPAARNLANGALARAGEVSEDFDIPSMDVQLRYFWDCSYEQKRKNLRFIAHARSDVPKLATTLLAALDRIEELEVHIHFMTYDVD